MHSVLAVATTHLCRLLPDNSTYKVAQAYHWQQAVSQYSREIKSGVGLHNMDALFSTCLLTSVLMFAAEDYRPANSWIFSSGSGDDGRENPETALNWLLLQCGLRHLLGLTQGMLPKSMWYDMFMESARNDDGSFDDHRPGRVDMHPGLADLCGIDDTTTEETSPYHWPLRMLSPMLRLEVCAANCPKYIHFMGRLLPDYLELLVKKDPPALVILSYWLALMCTAKLWWLEPRVKSECVAICMFLENSPDPQILPLLEFPANACGYPLKRIREINEIFDANVDLSVLEGI